MWILRKTDKDKTVVLKKYLTESNWDTTEVGAPTKDRLSTTSRFMEEGKRFSFIGYVFIPVEEKRDITREEAFGIMPDIAVNPFSDGFPNKCHLWSNTLCVSAFLTAGSTDSISDKFDKWLQVSSTVRIYKFH